MGKDSAPKNSGAAIKGFLIIPGSESLFGAVLHVHNTQGSGGGFAWIIGAEFPQNNPGCKHTTVGSSVPALLLPQNSERAGLEGL